MHFSLDNTYTPIYPDPSISSGSFLDAEVLSTPPHLGIQTHIYYANKQLVPASVELVHANNLTNICGT